ncbi:two-component system sensor histidine kinase MprB [Streptacidiphilus sp. MAP12-16]|uniref:sensor histidine kinase n=1 Tax=Streptacidiphilus sp. MAP12-16 TaxID=3156300 RepID=UPI003516AA04
MSGGTTAERRRLGGWFSRVTLRGRLALLSAVAVSVAVVLCAAASWFFARSEMTYQVDQTLRASVGPNPEVAVRHVASLCLGSNNYAPQSSATLIFSNNTSCPQTDSNTVKPTATDYAIAASGTSGPDAKESFHDGRTVGGTSVRVYTVSVGEGTLNGARVTVALAVAQPLKPVQDALNQLALIMVLVAALVIAGSALGALWVARAALRPVDRLTEAAEHIARTEELGTTIAVDGKDEIARLSESFNSMSTALASSRDRQSQLIADAGHELRTPLTSLRTNVDLLVRSEETGRALPPDTRTRMMRNMKAQMVELSTLIGDLLELSRPSRPKGAKPLEVLPLHDIAARALDRARLRGPGLTFNVDLKPWYVRADAHTMERAVINLLDNAVKFSPPGGTIDVRLRFGTLTVRDHGPGIPAEELPHVFDRFWRSPSARQMPGSGLGLAIVAQTIREAGGEVTLSAADEPGADGTTGGALATVRLPGAPTPPPPTPVLDKDIESSM